VLLLLVVTVVVATVEAASEAAVAAVAFSFHGSRDIFIKLSQPTLSLPTLRELRITCN
jgi:hypothetical protein